MTSAVSVSKQARQNKKEIRTKDYYNVVLYRNLLFYVTICHRFKTIESHTAHRYVQRYVSNLITYIRVTQICEQKLGLETI